MTINIFGDCHGNHRARVVFKLGAIQEQITPAVPNKCRAYIFKGFMVMGFEMKATQQVSVGVEFKDSKGNPAPVDGVPVWQTDNPAILTLEPTPDGLSCLVKATGMVGIANVQLTADADMGAGVTPVIGTLEVTITPGQATTVALAPGTPSEQP